MKMSEPARLHPVTIMLTFLKQLKESLIPFLVIFVLGLRDNGLGFPLGIVLTVLFISSLLLNSFLSWYRFTYRLEDGELRIEYGVFIRKKRYIPFERIQSLDYSENIFHQLFGLVKISVETAGSEGKQAEAVLAAVTKKEAEAIQKIFQEYKRTGAAGADERLSAEAKEETEIYKMSFQELLIMASTSGGVGVVITAVIAFLSQFDEWIPYEKWTKEFIALAANQIFLVSIFLLLGFLLAWIVAVIGMMLKYAGFTLKKTDKDLIITRGLLEKKQITIPFKRIQGIRISENIIRQPFRLATVHLESAGGSAGESGGSIMIMPLIKKDRIKETLSPHLQDYQFIDEFIPAPRRSLKRYLFRGFVIALPVLTAPVVIFKGWGLLAWLLLPVFLFWFYQKYRDAGWAVNGDQLSLRYRNIVRYTVYMRRRNIQSLSRQATYFQKRKNLATIRASIKSGIGSAGGRVVDLEEKDAAFMYRWFSRTGQKETRERPHGS